MNARAAIVGGSLIGALAFVAEAVGIGELARSIFFAGFGIALLGVVLLVFSPSGNGMASGLTLLLYRLGIVGFIIAALAVLSRQFMGPESWMGTTFRAGIAVFLVGLILSIILNRKTGGNNESVD